ncbi:cytokine-like protein 1 isoform 1-T1 [Sarcoramphus papa]
MKMLLSLIALLSAALLANAAPPTCYSRVLSLSKEITESFKELQTSKAVVSLPENCSCKDTAGFLLLTRFSQNKIATGLSSFLQDSCMEMLPRLYLDIHNYCVLAKLRDFVAYPRCERVLEVSELKEKARSLYTIMISYCRRDLVFLTDDCNALENPILPPIEPSVIES